MNVKELKQILKELPDETEIVMADKSSVGGWGVINFKVLSKARPNLVNKSISGNYFSSASGEFTNSLARVLEMVYD